MDYRQTYEILLKTICENSKKMLELLTHIKFCDEMLLEQSLQDEPDSGKIHALTTQKERLIQQIDNLSSNEENYIAQLNSIASLCSEVTGHPLYLKMELLHNALIERMRLVLHNEDLNNPTIIHHLENYKDKLQMDIRISEVPMEKRRIFYIYPDK